MRLEFCSSIVVIDALGARFLITAMMIRFGNEQEAYDFVRSLADQTSIMTGVTQTRHICIFT